MRILLLTAMPQEVDPLVKAGLLYKEHVQLENNNELRLFSGAPHPSLKLSVGLLGIGKVNAAFATTLYIKATEPDIVILFGTAGGLNKELKQSQLYAASSTWTYDYGAHNPQGFVRWQSGTIPIGEVQAPTKIGAPAAVRELLERHHPDIEWRPMASGDCFLNNSDMSQQLFEEGADLVDMESSVVADIAQRFNIPSLILRVISDSADNNAHSDFLSNLDKVCADVTPKLINILYLLDDDMSASG
jgi:5'-methylthioadenosine/S-adenosylhomocysteine nucleosidase